MKITVVGSGYVGLVTGACLAELGNNVFCLDLDQNKIDLLNAGYIPIYEPGLEQIILRNKASGRLQFSTDVKEAVRHGEIQYIAVGTPAGEDGSADLQYVLAAAKNIGKYMTEFRVIVNKSTVPVGTADLVKIAIAEELSTSGRNLDYSVVSNPEFLKEGAAVEDFMRPDRIVIGLYEDESGYRAKELLKKLYAPFNRNHERTFYMGIRSAELTKYAANAMLATRISFMNELANLSEKIGADIESVRQGIGSDSRIGYDFLYAGTGYGGSCFPKDVQALIKTGEKYEQELNLIQAVQLVNDLQKMTLVKKIRNRFGTDLSGKTFAIWGLAFKPNTDDMREAPSRVIIKELIKCGARVQAYDPIAMKEAKNNISLDLQENPEWVSRICYGESMVSVLDDADALIIATEWKEFKSPDFELIKLKLNNAIIYDGRNLYDPNVMSKIGIEYFSIGRSNC